jgi:hypothetical protein
VSEPLTFAIDYDGTYDASPELWTRFTAMAHASGHKVIMITARSRAIEMDAPPNVPVYYTARKAKRDWIRKHGMKVDVWIDNDPWFIFNGK